MSGPLGSSQWMYASGGYEIDQSLRFDDVRDTHLSRTPTSDSNMKTYTISCWVKLNEDIAATQPIFSSYVDANNYTRLTFISGNKLSFMTLSSGNWAMVNKSTPGYRDFSAWYHVVLAVDTTQGTNTNRVKLYVNGAQIAVEENTWPSQNADTFINDASGIHYLGRDDTTGVNMHMSEFHLIDGTALTPSSFGESGDYGEWKPIEVEGLTYGTNGFYLPFKQDYSVEGFSAVTYKGDGGYPGSTPHGRYIGGVGFQPDVNWTKARTDTHTHHMTFANISYNKRHQPSTTTEETATTSRIEGWEPDGYKLGHYGEVNAAADKYVSWNWDMGGSSGSNSDGSVTTQVRANTTYGQSIVTYTGTGSTATFGHGLDSAPDFGIIHGRSNSGDWMVYFGDNTDFLKLNETNAREDLAAVWNDTSPSSTVFTLGDNGDVNVSGRTYVSLWFHSVTGYSSFGTYSGDGTYDGSKTVTCGFSPAWVMIKCTNDTESWWIFDNARNPLNGGEDPKRIQANVDTAEITGGSTGSDWIEFTSTGFKMTGQGGGTNGGSGQTYFYAAFADMREYAYWLDQSGNNNDWNSERMTESDISKDTPTNNYCTWNINATEPSGVATLGEGGLKGTTGQDYNGTGSTFNIHQDGKSYMEFYPHTIAGDIYMGIAASNELMSSTKMYDSDPSYAYRSDGILIYGGGSNTGTDIDSFGHGDIIQLAVDTSANKLWIGKNNTWQMSGTQNPSTGTGGYSITDQPEGYTVIFGTGSNNSTNVGVANFGQDSSFAGSKPAQGNGAAHEDFYYTPPTGFKALCAKNLPVPDVTPSEHFNTVIYTGDGDGSGKSITGVGFQPDFVWIKDRSHTESHRTYDSIRGVHENNGTNGAYIDWTDAQSLQSFDSDGFTVGNENAVNNDHPYVAWNWLAGNATLGTGDFTQGNLASTCSRNVAAGFSIVKYTGNATNAATIGHGLSKAPDMVILKNIERTSGWRVGGARIGNGSTNYLTLNTTADLDNASTGFQAFTSTTFQIGNDTDWNASGEDIIAYCFHSVEGYSKVGSYTGLGNANGMFCYTGFRPAWVMGRRTNADEDWFLFDTTRNPYNPVNGLLYPNGTNAEYTGVADRFDIYSNGFKLRDTDGKTNGAGDSYIYLAFAETPFKYANAR